MAKTQVNKKFKDSLFRMIFREKEELLSLYNAINGSDHQNPEDLRINTMEDVVYMSMKNDVSFLFHDYLNLYEAQSTVCENMPARGLIYFSLLLQGYVDEMNLNLYSSKQISLPTPRFVVFYNGQRKEAERKFLRLSDSFLQPFGEEGPALECVAQFLNINYGHNRELMEKCRKLYEYSYFVEAIRNQQKKGLSIEEAVELAIQECIDEQILETFLRKHRGEVMDVILTEYDEKRHIEDEKNLSLQEGIEIGRQEGRLLELVEMCRDFHIPREGAVARLIEKFSMTVEDAEAFVGEHWKE